METKQTTDASKFLRGGIYNTQEEALLGVITTPIPKTEIQGQSPIDKMTSDKFVKSFFPRAPESL